MAKYDLSSPAAIAVAAKVAAEKAGSAPNQGSYNAAWLQGYASALKDCGKGLEPMQKLFDSVIGYLGEHYDSRELCRMFHEDMGMTDEEIEFLGFDLGEPDELDGEIEDASGAEYVHDFGNGYKVLRVYANQLPDGCYGDIYDSRADAEREHPDEKIVMGYCVVDVVSDGYIPLGCNDWNNTVEEAIVDYTDNVVPGLEIRNMEVASWEDMDIKYPMDRDEMTVEQEEAWVKDCYKLYEQEGFSPRYWSPFSDNQERVGLPIEIVGRVEADESHDLSVLPMWKARLDGCEFEVFPEEVVPSEMKANGCRWFENMVEYDRELSEKMIGLDVDVMSPQEMADATGKAVKDRNKYYLPKDILPVVDKIIQNAEERTVSPIIEGKDTDLEIG